MSMDKDVHFLVFGNQDLPESTDERPLVTFALFAYNQERYIQEAVEGALAQTYSPLEIIISDDSSSDRTYEIMRGLAENYSGPHLLKLSRSITNQGLLSHINKVIGLANGEIVIMAAGDDISFPLRTAVIVKSMCEMPKLMAVYSECSNCTTYCHASNFYLHSVSEANLAFSGGGIGAGAAYAYRKDCFISPEPLPKFLFSEDRILPLRAGILGGVGHLNIALVYHRDTPSSASKFLSARRLLSYDNIGHLDFLLSDMKPLLQSASLSRRYLLLLMIKFRRFIAQKDTLGKKILNALVYRFSILLIRATDNPRRVKINID